MRYCRSEPAGVRVPECTRVFAPLVQMDVVTRMKPLAVQISVVNEDVVSNDRGEFVAGCGPGEFASANVSASVAMLAERFQIERQVSSSISSRHAMPANGSRCTPAHTERTADVHAQVPRDAKRESGCAPALPSRPQGHLLRPGGACCCADRAMTARYGRPVTTSRAFGCWKSLRTSPGRVCLTPTVCCGGATTQRALVVWRHRCCCHHLASAQQHLLAGLLPQLRPHPAGVWRGGGLQGPSGPGERRRQTPRVRAPVLRADVCRCLRACVRACAFFDRWCRKCSASARLWRAPRATSAL
jgi:hypothetical protein